jgi:hypothetical protein
MSVFLAIWPNDPLSGTSSPMSCVGHPVTTLEAQNCLVDLTDPGLMGPGFDPLNILPQIPVRVPGRVSSRRMKRAKSIKAPRSIAAM